MRGFGSDNHSGVHPEILSALIACNQGHCPSYGTDIWSEKLQDLIKEKFGKHAEAFLVFNGTGANALSIKTLLKSYQSVICADLSHINVDECGAPELLAGCKLIPIRSRHGKISLNDIQKAFIRRGDQHFSQVGAVSLTQPTELGTCYTLEEIKEIAEWCRSQKIYLHIDGARLANAAIFLKCSLMDLCAGADVVSLGGTKNGFMMGEAVVFLNPTLCKEFKYIRKQCAQLPSKTRFVAASFLKYLQADLWKQIAEHSCQMAQILFDKLKDVSELEITAPRQSNAVFVKIPQALVKELRKSYFFYVWNEESFECRLMTSWDTKEEDIDGFIEKLKDLISKGQ